MCGCQASQQSTCDKAFLLKVSAPRSKLVGLVSAAGSGIPPRDRHLPMIDLLGPDRPVAISMG